jgi:hypothetical protein
VRRAGIAPGKSNCCPAPNLLPPLRPRCGSSLQPLPTLCKGVRRCQQELRAVLEQEQCLLLADAQGSREGLHAWRHLCCGYTKEDLQNAQKQRQGASYCFTCACHSAGVVASMHMGMPGNHGFWSHSSTHAQGAGPLAANSTTSQQHQALPLA